ncbi:DNA mismatch repair protein [Nowakowskiella sp. JEL0407]|nr:DNA mismatch repair protein [Nowakowskiella sp. JEL0407]
MEPASIQKLDEIVINRIAAGEVIHRPANALKELIENCLDANASSITITIKEGGLKLLQIQDNGTGIRKEDLAIVCERFTTSKLSKFEDLKTIRTFGFRGEALASITHVAHVSITTKTRDSQCAWKAHYADGKLIPPRPGASADPKPCAGNNGTQITVEDLFYNVPTRRKALKNANDEYLKILDVVTKYAIHNSGVAFTCKKLGSTTLDVHTGAKSSISSNIGSIYGSAVSKEILDFESKSPELEYEVSGRISHANYSMKKMNFLLFINHRLVDCSELKRAIENLYSTYLPKGSHPFVYLDLRIKSENVDVNVHPTKNEEKIIESICEAMQTRLASATTSRVFYTQTLLPGSKLTLNGDNDDESPKQNSITKVKQSENKLVRTDSKTQTLDSFLVPISHESNVSSQLSRKNERFDGDQLFPDEYEDEMDLEMTPIASKVREGSAIEVDDESDSPNIDLGTQREFVEVNLTSVLELREEVHGRENKGVTEVFKEHTFVGCVDNVLALIQKGTKLYMIDYRDASYELFYQLSLKSFANFGFINISTPTSIYELVKIALNQEDDKKWDNDNLMSKDEIAQNVAEIFVNHKEMLEEYFSIRVSEDGMLYSLPIILKGYLPNWSKLPFFCLRVASDVDWESEKTCFESFCRTLAFFYAFEGPVEESDEDQTMDSMNQTDTAIEEYKWTVQHLLFPTLKSSFSAPQVLIENGSIVQVADLPELYKVFERC